jgi:hypothetical protein
MALANDSPRDDVGCHRHGVTEYHVPAAAVAWKAGEVVGMTLATGIAGPLVAGMLAMGVVPEGAARNLTTVSAGAERIIVQAGPFRFPQTTSQFAVGAAPGLPVYWDATANAAVNTDNNGANAFLGDLIIVRTTSIVEVDVRIGNSLRVAAENLLAFNAPTELTIASGAVTATQTLHSIDTQGDAASDDLDTISGTVNGEIYLVRPQDAGRTVVIRDTGGGTGNIRTPFAQSISLAELTDWAMLVSDGTNLTVIAFRTAAANGGGAGVIIGLLSALTTTDKSTVVAALNEVKANAIAAPAYQAGTATLVSGTVDVATGITVAANSRVIPLMIGDITGSTNFAGLREIKSSRVNGAPGVGTIRLQAVGADGQLDADAAGAIDFVILTPQS